jgi:hypothetical protein
MRRAVITPLLVVALWSVSRADGEACLLPSGNIQVTPVLAPVVRSLVDVSPTFSQQCDRIAAVPLVRVTIGVLPKSQESCCRARTAIRRYPSGLIMAVVEIPSPLRKTEYAELLGHEFEHIVERLDGVDVTASAQLVQGSVYGGTGAYETKRAQWAGKAVAAEAERSGTVD